MSFGFSGVRTENTGMVVITIRFLVFKDDSCITDFVLRELMQYRSKTHSNNSCVYCIG